MYGIELLKQGGSPGATGLCDDIFQPGIPLEHTTQQQMAITGLSIERDLRHPDGLADQTVAMVRNTGASMVVHHKFVVLYRSKDAVPGRIIEWL